MTNVSKFRRLRSIATPLLVAMLASMVGHAQSELEGNSEKPDRLRVAYFFDRSSDVDSDSLRTAVNRWAQTVSPGRVTAKVEADGGRMNKAISTGNFDLYGLFGYQYLELADETSLRPSFVTTGGRGSTSSFILVTRIEDNIKSLHGLRDKKILVDTGAFGELPLIWLATEIGTIAPIKEVRGFASVTPVKNSVHALLPVYFEKADACVISQDAFREATTLNREITTKLHYNFKMQSRPLLVSMFGFNPDYPLAAAAKIQSEVVKTAKSREAGVFLKQIQRQSFEPFEESSLNSLRALYKKYQSLFMPEADAEQEGDAL